MNLVRANIINNPKITGLSVNPVQFVERAAQAMFVEYNDSLDGAVYLIQAKQWKHMAIEFDTFGIDYEVLSTHTIGGKDLEYLR